MATQVNKKIVVAIVAGIVALSLGVVGAAVYITQKSPAKNIARGDAAFQAGDYELAQDQYSRAVNKEPTNVEYIDKWADALVRTVPDNDADYEKSYNMYLNGVLALKSEQRPQNGAFQLAYVDEFVRRVRMGGVASANVLDQVVTQIEGRAAGLADDDPDRVRVLRWRGWALANKADLAQISDEEYQRATEDLQRAYELENDANALVDLHTLHRAVARRAETDRRTDLASRSTEAAETALDTLRENHAKHPSVIALDLLAKRLEASRNMTPAMAEPTIREASVIAADEFSQIDVSAYDPTTLVSAARALMRYTPADLNDKIDAPLERKLEELPANSHIMMLRAELAADARDADRAVDLFQAVIDTPNQPVSLDGWRLLRDRRLALYSQARLRVKQAEFVAGDAKGELLDEAEALREALSERILTQEENMVRKLDAQITLQRALIAPEAEEEALLNEALTLLRELESADASYSRDPDVLLGYILALLEKGQPGNAREKLLELDRLTGGNQNAQTLLYWATVESQLGNLPEALRYYRELQEIIPDNTFIRARIGELVTLVEGGDAPEADPVVLAINRSRDLRSEGDLAGALTVLESAMTEFPEDERLIRLAVSLDLSMDNRERGIERVRSALDRTPESTFLQNLLTRLEVEDPVEAQLQIIASSDASELDKALQRESVYFVARRMDESRAQLEAALAIDADDPAVVDRAFVRAAMRGKDGLDDAERYVEAASRIDLDGHGGDIYRARLAILKGEAEQAIEILGAITEANPFDADAWRWLGAAQRSAGLIDAAVESYTQAYRANPRDVGYAGDLANALVAAGRGVEAAAVLSPETGVLQYGQGGDQLIEQWLQLEGRFGDRESVKRMRETSYERDPSTIINTLAYLQLLLDDEQYDRAQEVIDGYANSRNPREIRVAQMLSALRAKQGRFDEAVAILNDYIDATPEDERTGDAYRILARLYEENGDLVKAAETYRRGRPYQGEAMILDRSLADLRFRYASELRGETVQLPPDAPNKTSDTELFQAGYREAMEVYQSILDEGGFDELIAKRIAECQLRLKMYTQLNQTLDTIQRETGNPYDLQVLLIRAVAAEEQGDRAALDEYLNLAVQYNASNPVAYFRRAQVNTAYPERLPDVLADLEEAVKLRPGYVEAWGLLAQTYTVMGEPEQAFQKIRGAAEANPNDERLPRVLVELLVSTGRFNEALDEATRKANADNEDLYWVDRAARLAQRTGNYDVAYRWLTIQDEQTEFSDERVALDRLNCLLRRNSGVEIPELNRLMRRVDEIIAEGDARIVINLLKARAEAARGNKRASDQLVIAAHELARPIGPVALRLVVEALMLRGMQTRDAEAAQTEMLEFIRDTAELKPLHPYLKLELIQPSVFGAETREQREQVNEALEAVGAEVASDDQVTLYRYHRLASNLRYALGDYEGTVEASQAALAIAPNSPEMANNLAYTLSTHLGRHEEALPYAQQAARLQPRASYVLDTLGVIQLRTGNVNAALETLERAVVTAVGPDNLAAALLHKAEALLEADRRSEAMQTATRAQRQMGLASSQTRELYAEDLQSLIDRLR
ncbi:MAG: hypothetical protein Tsb0013_05180 [Phycisphaerales bacterium]